jgi:hypothetical protein
MIDQSCVLRAGSARAPNPGRPGGPSTPHGSQPDGLNRDDELPSQKDGLWMKSQSSARAQPSRVGRSGLKVFKESGETYDIVCLDQDQNQSSVSISKVLWLSYAALGRCP